MKREDRPKALSRDPKILQRELNELILKPKKVKKKKHKKIQTKLPITEDSFNINFD